MKKGISFVLLFSAMLIWGTSFLVMKNTLDEVKPGFLIFTRGFVSFIVLLPIVIKNRKKINKNKIIFTIFTGSIVASAYLIQVIGLQYTTPGKSAFLEDAYCVVVPILTWILLKKKPNILSIITILLCLGGVFLISLESFDKTINIGDILSIVAGLLFGVNIALTGIYAKNEDPLIYTFGQFVVIMVISFIYTICFERELIVFSNNVILSLIYLGVFVTALAWVFRNYAQKHLSPITISVVLPFSAVVSTIISAIAKEDVITLPFVIGAVLITASIIIDAVFSYIKEKKYEF